MPHLAFKISNNRFLLIYTQKFRDLSDAPSSWMPGAGHPPLHATVLFIFYNFYI